jgi:uncharacterized protein
VAVYLLDVNVLVALTWPLHSAHDVAGRWFNGHGKRGWATCPLSQAGLVRILSNRVFSPDALRPTQALQVLRRSVALPGHQFWADSIDLLNAFKLTHASLAGHQQVTDAYLVGLAVHNGGKLATLDRKIAQIAPAGAVEVIG